MIIDDKLRKRFWSKVQQKTSGCWLWTGAVDAKWGYGWFWTKDGPVKAHRMAYKLTKGKIPSGKCVCHSCDVPSCCNPSHLWLGSHQQNIADRHTKGRSRGGPSGDNHHTKLKPELIPFGTQRYNAKMTEAKVLKARQRFANGEKNSLLAQEYGIKRCTMWEILHGRSWIHVPML